jgi:hypothetical protein
MATPIFGLKKAAPEKQTKVSQEAARYDPPEKGPFKCSTCEYFMAPDACKIIEGEVAAEGCCALWEKK